MHVQDKGNGYRQVSLLAVAPCAFPLAHAIMLQLLARRMWNLAPSGKALWTLLRSFYAAKGILSMAGGSLRLRYCPDKLLPKPTFDGNSIAKLLVVYERVERVRIVNRVLPTQSYTLYLYIFI